MLRQQGILLAEKKAIAFFPQTCATLTLLVAPLWSISES